MAHIIVNTMSLDAGHYGLTSYNCSECGHDCGKESVEKCPKCGVEFDEPSEDKFEAYPFGGSDF